MEYRQNFGCGHNNTNKKGVFISGEATLLHLTTSEAVQEDMSNTHLTNIVCQKEKRKQRIVQLLKRGNNDENQQISKLKNGIYRKARERGMTRHQGWMESWQSYSSAQERELKCNCRGAKCTLYF